MGMILRIASSRIVGQGDIVGRSGYFSLNLSANSVMRGRLDARRTLKSLVADLRFIFQRMLIQITSLYPFHPNKDACNLLSYSCSGIRACSPVALWHYTPARR